MTFGIKKKLPYKTGDLLTDSYESNFRVKCIMKQSKQNNIRVKTVYYETVKTMYYETVKTK